MMRSFVVAAGISLILLGAEFMFVDRLVMADLSAQSSSGYETFSGLDSGTTRRVFVPPEWAPWGLLSGGVVAILYAATFDGSGSGD